MKLYYAPGACSLAPHIALREAGLSFDLDKVDLATKKHGDGKDYLKVNPKGYVPALDLNGAGTMTEVAALLQYIADQAPEKNLAPRPGTMERYRLQEWLNFVSSELHKGIGALFNKETPAAYVEMAKTKLATRLAVLDRHLAANDYLMGKDYSVADAYAFVILGWTKYFNIDLATYPNVQKYLARIASRPSVQAALKAEGLAK
jgi:glutathione S-transferase